MIRLGTIAIHVLQVFFLLGRPTGSPINPVSYYTKKIQKNKGHFTFQSISDTQAVATFSSWHLTFRVDSVSPGHFLQVFLFRLETEWVCLKQRQACIYTGATLIN